MNERARRFCEAVTHPEFSHVEDQVVLGVEMLVAYRHDPASAAGRGWLASIPRRDW